MPVSSNGIVNQLTENTLVWLQNKIDGTVSEYVVAYMPTTNNQLVNAVLNLKQFG